MDPPADDYLAAWNTLHRLRRRERQQLLAFVVVAALLLPAARFEWATPVATAMFVVFAAMFLPTAIAITRFRCPRCTSFFFYGSGARWPRAKVCDSCGLEIGTPATPSVPKT